MNPRSDGQMGELYGAPVIVYDGTNAEAIVKAMHLSEGDAVVILEPHKAIILRASQLDMMREVSFEQFRRNFSTPRPQHSGLIRKLVEEGES